MYFRNLLLFSLVLLIIPLFGNSAVNVLQSGISWVDEKVFNRSIENFESNISTATVTMATLNSEVETLGEQLLNEGSAKKKSSEYEKVQNQIEYKLQREEKELTFYQTNSTCSTCKQIIDDEFKKERVIDISKKIDEKKDGLDKLHTEIDSLEKTLKQYREIGGSIVEKNKELVIIQSKIGSLGDNIERVQKEINALKSKKKHDSSIEKELKVLKENLEESLQDYSELCNRKKLHEYAHELLRDSGIKTKIIRPVSYTHLTLPTSDLV